MDTSCIPAADDLEFGFQATQARLNHNTNYYTIYGYWVWYNMVDFPQQGNPIIPSTDDGLVPVWSVNSELF